MSDRSRREIEASMRAVISELECVMDSVRDIIEALDTEETEDDAIL